MLLLSSFCIFAQSTQLVAWDFENANSTPVLTSGISSASIAKSSNLQNSSLTNSYSVTNLTATTLAQAKNGFGTTAAQYISVTITPSPNFAIDITNVAIHGYSQNRNRTFNLSYIDAQGTLVNVQNRNITTPTEAETFNLSSLTGIQTPIELRFYIFSNPADQYEAAGFGEMAGLDLVINGKITNTTTNPILPGMWSLQGNTVAGSQFLGSVNSEAVKIYTNNTEKLRINPDGNIGIGTCSPTQKLSVAGNINLTGTGSGLIFDDGSFVNSASKINNSVQNGQSSDVSLTGLALQNLTLAGNRINYTGSALEFYTPVQGQYNDHKPVLSMSQFGEMNFYSSPYLNYNTIYLKNTGDYNNGIRHGAGFGTVTGFEGPVVFGQNGGALGSSTANQNWSTTGTNVALSWDNLQNVKIHKALRFADGTVQTTAGVTAVSQPVTYNNTSNYYTYQGNVNIPGTLKLGTNSLYLGSNTSGTAGTSNFIYADVSDLLIQSNPSLNFNTIINSGNSGKVGIGVAAPLAKLHVGGNILVDGKIEVRDRIDIGRDDNNPLIRIGSLIMQDFSTYSVQTINNGTDSGLETISTPESFVFGNIYFDEISQTYKSIFDSDSFIPYYSTSNPKSNRNGGTALRFDSDNGNLEFITIPKSQGGGGFGFSLTKEELLDQRRLIVGDEGVSISGIGSALFFPDGTMQTTADGGWIRNENDVSYLLGNVGIGTTATTGYKLSVEGKIRTREVDVNNLVWSDYVFDKSYKLPKLDEVEKYINKNGHLENIPDAKTVAEKGYGLSEMDAMLLRKIEELTLYTIELKKEIEKLKK